MVGNDLWVSPFQPSSKVKPIWHAGPEPVVASAGVKGGHRLIYPGPGSSNTYQVSAGHTG